MPTEKYPGVVLLFWASSLSPSQPCTLKTTAALEDWFVSPVWMHAMFRNGGAVEARCAYHPMYRLRMKMAAMGRVEDSVELISTLSPFGAGS